MKTNRKAKNTIFICVLAVISMLPFTMVHADSSPAANDLAKDATNLANKTVSLVKDSAITGYIYAQIALDNNLSKFNVNVSTDNGRVKLQGTVDAESQVNELIQIATSASGVTSVDASQLKARKSNQPVTDIAITTALKTKYAYEKILNNPDMPANISVETNNGVVYLSGIASTSAQAENAVRIAQSTSGVSRVESTIQVMTVKR